MLNDNDVRTALVVAAHPDDIDFGAAGTVAHWTDTGVSVTYLVVTDGDAGGFDPDMPREEIPPLRRAEQTEAAKHVGVTDLRFLGYPDGWVATTFALRRDITRVIRQVRPDRMIGPTPERNYERIGPSHPDHRAVGAAMLDAVYPDARNQFAYPELIQEEGLHPWTVREVWLSGGSEGDHYVDVTETFDRKIAALRAHVSQTGHMDELDDMVRSWLAASAQRAGLPDGRLAEKFRVVPTG